MRDEQSADELIILGKRDNIINSLIKLLHSITNAVTPNYIIIYIIILMVALRKDQASKKVFIPSNIHKTITKEIIPSQRHNHSLF